MLGLFGILLSSACRKDDRENGYLRVQMKDAPALYQQVNVDVQQVRVHLYNGNWIDLPTTAGVYDLLTLQNGVNVVLVNPAQLPVGHIDQMRLVLGSNNTIMVDSVIYPLTIPSGSESGVKLNGDIIIPANTTVTVMLDFVANESILQEGNGSWKMKPVINVVP